MVGGGACTSETFPGNCFPENLKKKDYAADGFRRLSTVTGLPVVKGYRLPFAVTVKRLLPVTDWPSGLVTVTLHVPAGAGRNRG